ncbi:MAG: hypothetical protein K2I79_00635 [Clostridia bacterium]|nr:hypothetical protein [Clostridia bacterium]
MQEENMCAAKPDCGDGLEEKLEKFMVSYPAAIAIAKEIAEEVQKDKELISSPYCLECAMGRALARLYRTPQQLIGDKEFREKYVMRDEEIKKAIIDAYVQDIRNAAPPNAMCGKVFIAAAGTSKPESLSDAGKLFERMLKNRR